MEYVSARLSQDEIIAYLRVLPSIFSEIGLVECKVMYGWQCELPIDDLWQEQLLKVTEIPTFVSSSMERRIFKPGSSDLFVESSDGSLSVQLCHESDIHLTSSSESSLAALASPIAIQHPDFTYKQNDSWLVRRFSGRA